MACNLTKSIDTKSCDYAIAGARALYLANFYPAIEGDASQAGAIVYTYNVDGEISGIHLPTGEVFYRIGASANTISFTDALLTGGNGGKYRQHTANAVINQLDLDTLTQGDAMSLGRFVAVVVDNAGRVIVLGRISGLTAPAGGFDYASGAADADANGWTLILQGSSTELGQIVENETVISPIYVEVITP